MHKLQKYIDRLTKEWKEHIGIPEGELGVKQECTPEEEAQGLLQVIYENGKDRKSTRLNSSHSQQSRMPSSA